MHEATTAPTTNAATTTVSNTSNTTSNVLNTIPKAMFANCQIGSININFGKKLTLLDKNYVTKQKNNFI